MKFGQVIECNKIIFFFKNNAKNKSWRLDLDLLLFLKKGLYEVKVSGLKLSLNIF